MHVLTWYSPLEGIRGRILDVRRGEAVLDYRGPMVKRGAPPASAYAEIGPGATVTHTFDLARSYDLSQPGTYTVSFNRGLGDVVYGASFVLRPRSAHEGVSIPCSPVSFEIR